METPGDLDNTHQTTDAAATAAAATTDIDIDATMDALSNTLSLASSTSSTSSPPSPSQSSAASRAESNPGASPSPRRTEEGERWADHDIDAAASASAANNNNTHSASATDGAGNTNTTLIAARTPPRRDTIHQNYPSVSPTRVQVSQSYIIGRTQSSPSIIDASPKMRQTHGIGYGNGKSSLSPKPGTISISTSGRVQNHHPHQTSQLTPVAGNTTKPFAQNNTNTDNAANTAANEMNKDKKLQYLSVPETSTSSSAMPKISLQQTGAKRGEGSNNNNNSSSMIRPRITTTPGSISTSDESNDGSRPISPPSWLSHRASTCTAPTSTSARNVPALASIPSSGSSPHSSTSSPSSSKENTESDLVADDFHDHEGHNRENEPLKDEQNHFPSSLNTRVRLDRNHYSFPCKYQQRQRQRHQSSPEAIFGSNASQPRSPGNEGQAQGAKASGGGSLDNGLGATLGLGIGIGEMDNDSSLQELLIAQPYQPSRNSSLASFGVAPEELDDIFLPMRRHRSSKSKSSSKLRRSNGLGYGGDSDDDDVDDSYTQMSDSQSSTSFTSFPSIRLGVRIRSSTGDSVTTVEGCSTFDDEDSLVFQHQDGSLYLGSGGSVGGGRSTAASAEKKKKNHGRRLSSHEEKQVYDWLRGLEVDKDNNEYVAEAASSKFLTGKMNNIDEHAAAFSHGRFVASPELVSRVAQVKNDEQKLDGNDDNNVDMNEKKDSSRGDPSSVRSVKSSSNNIVMGRNVCAFDRNRRSATSSSIKNNSKGKPSSFKVSGLYR